MSMRVTTLGATGVRVTELSFGAAGIGNLFRPVTDEAAHATVEAAWDAGVRTFDTAPHYGLGLSERRLGTALRDRDRDTYTVSTKVGRLLEPNPEGSRDDDLAHGFAVPAAHRRVWDFSSDGVLRSLEASLDRLGLDRVDTALLHDPDHHAEQALTEAYPALERLRAEGVVKAIGLGVNQCALPVRFLRETDIDVVLLAGRYTLLEQEGLAEVLPEAADRGRSVIVGGVFNSGLLTDPEPGATYDYAPAPPHVLDRALRMKTVTERHGVPLRAAALRFPSGHPAVASVLSGARCAEEVRDTVDQLRRTVPAAVWDGLRAEGLLPPHVPVPATPPVEEAGHGAEHG
ncbi:oxidoreductase, aldo/keto reductase family protein [Streptomyces turgidiscabies Car8]|uniref:Oxidoreductase, aldo/keto reductase family protein n=2 Tax=Streptomyces TaxID=1883 RepID=L7FAA5_STRT8|nr:oxidoreductase, aldo/keto reductase family protein [Streptomyces turgidiscabies Car8]GAQ68545.1 D-threo-aldose 1-dehydrogenase [Streptomyces turgidiscabies]